MKSGERLLVQSASLLDLLCQNPSLGPESFKPSSMIFFFLSHESLVYLNPNPKLRRYICGCLLMQTLETPPHLLTSKAGSEPQRRTPGAARRCKTFQAGQTLRGLQL